MREKRLGQIVVNHQDFDKLFALQRAPLFSQEHAARGQEKVIAGNDWHPTCLVKLADVSGFSAEAFHALKAPTTVGQVVYPMLIELGLCRQLWRSQSLVGLYLLFGARNDLVIALGSTLRCCFAFVLPDIRGKTTPYENFIGCGGSYAYLGRFLVD